MRHTHLLLFFPPLPAKIDPNCGGTGCALPRPSVHDPMHNTVLVCLQVLPPSFVVNTVQTTRGVLVCLQVLPPSFVA